jgi:hypothetical protein
MNATRSIRTLLIAGVLVGLTATPARANGPKVELGTSLASVIVTVTGGSSVTFGVPSGGFGIVNPGLYISIFTGPHVSIEPQVGLIAVSGGGASAHVLNMAGQLNYFLRDAKGSSPYVFGSMGALSVTGAGTTPLAVSAGVGFRARVGDRLTMRIDGRYEHFTKGGGNAIAFTVSLGGVFGGK